LPVERSTRPWTLGTYEETFVVHEGRLSFTVEDQMILAGAGQIVIAPLGSVQGARVADSLTFVCGQVNGVLSTRAVAGRLSGFESRRPPQGSSGAGHGGIGTDIRVRG
jgi:hypothetical protein